MNKPPTKICPECRREIPIERGRFVFHYIQDKGWQGKDGKIECHMSGIQHHTQSKLFGRRRA